MTVSATPRQLREWDRRHSWHPFTHMRQYIESEPVIIRRGEGIRLQDVEGRWYLDGCSSIWLNVHGHRAPAIDAAIRRQLDEVAHATMLGQANVPATVLAKRLADVAPSGLQRVHFSDSGASAVEIAVKTAIQYWWNQGRPEKRQVLGFTNNYHGDTLGAMAVAPSELFHRPFLDLLPVNPQLPFPRCADRPLVGEGERCAPAHGDAIAAYFEQHAMEIAAVIIEPVEGAGGMIPAPPGFLRLVRELCDRFDVLLIIDEVATGFGHTGYRFACTPEHVTPDILCLGKGLSGGYLPIAATLTTDAVFEAFLGEVRERRTLFHGHSFAGNPLACAASIASLDLMENLLPALPTRVEHLAARLRDVGERSFVGETRQRGFMVGIDLLADPATGTEFEWDALAGYVVADEARARGLLIRPIGNVVILLPPPAATETELTEIAEITVASIEAAAPRLAALAAPVVVR